MPIEKIMNNLILILIASWPIAGLFVGLLYSKLLKEDVTLFDIISYIFGGYFIALFIIFFSTLHFIDSMSSKISEVDFDKIIFKFSK